MILWGRGSRRKWGEGEVGVAMKGQRDRFPCGDGEVSTWAITLYVVYCILSCKVLSLGEEGKWVKGALDLSEFVRFSYVGICRYL